MMIIVFHSFQIPSAICHLILHTSPLIVSIVFLNHFPGSRGGVEGLPLSVLGYMSFHRPTLWSNIDVRKSNDNTGWNLQNPLSHTLSNLYGDQFKSNTSSYSTATIHIVIQTACLVFCRYLFL